MSRIRVVLDTNCYVSVFTKPNGFVARLRAAWERGLFVPLICEEAMAELEEVLQRPRFLLSPDEQAWAFVNIRFYAETIALSDPLAPVEGLRDPDDIIFVNLARESKADCLVSGDKDILALKATLPGVDILSPGDFLRLIDADS